MAYDRTPGGNNFAQTALTKAVVYFTDDNRRTFHSRDTNVVHKKPNKDLGINRLRKYILSKKDKVKVAIIYDNVTGQEITKFKEGQWH